MIGVIFVLAAWVDILLLAGNPHGGEHLKDLLVGQILWVGSSQLSWWRGFRLCCSQRLAWLGRAAGPLGFYVVFAWR